MFRLLLRTRTQNSSKPATNPNLLLPSTLLKDPTCRSSARPSAASDSTQFRHIRPFPAALFVFSRRSFKSGRDDFDARGKTHDESENLITDDVLPPDSDGRAKNRSFPSEHQSSSGDYLLVPRGSGRLLRSADNRLFSEEVRSLSDENGPVLGGSQLRSREEQLLINKKSSPARENPLRLQLNGFASAYTCGAAGVAILLLLVAAISHSKGDDSIFVLPVPWNVVSEVWNSSLDAWRKISTYYGTFCNAMSASYAKLFDAAKDTTILIRCLKVILFSKGEDCANEYALRWRLKVVSLLADLLSSDSLRRKALLHANGGSVVDWLLDSVGHGEFEWRMIQDEAARAISYLLLDATTCEELLQRPSALCHLLLFSASIQSDAEQKKTKQNDLEFLKENNSRTRGRSMLVAAIMDIITSSCETVNMNGIQPKLSRNADVKDVLAALKVLKEGGLHFDEGQDDSQFKGHDSSTMNGIGGTIVEEKALVDDQNDQTNQTDKNDQKSYIWTLYAYWGNKWWNSNKDIEGSGPKDKLLGLNATDPKDLKGSMKIHGLWDDLQGKYVAVPLAAWAIATWAHTSSANCEKIVELDKNGDGILAAIMAPERTVKWHGAITSRLIVENGYENYVVQWGNALLNAAREVSETEDMQLALMTLNSFYSCVKRSVKMQESVSAENLSTLREIATETSKNVNLQGVIAEILDILSFNGVGFSAQEGKKWCTILFHWMFHDSFENTTHLTAARILADVLEKLGVDGVPLSQTWLAMIIFDIVNGVEPNMTKTEVASSKSKALVQNRSKQVATQAATEVAKAVWKSMGEANGFFDMKPTSNGSELEWEDLAKLDIFRSFPKGARKEKAKLTAVNAADVSVKAMKALGELSADEEYYQIKMLEKGALYLLRRFMLNDDYEKSDMPFNQAEEKRVMQESADFVYVPESKMPPSVHLRRHALRMLAILSLQPLASSFLKDDQNWYRWLVDCSLSRIPNCKDLKTCSYARATLYNVDTVNRFALYNLQNLRHDKLPWPHYEDRVFLVNTESPLWRLSTRENLLEAAGDVVGNEEEQALLNDFDMDVVFVHGLCGGPFKTWRITDDKTATVTAGLVEKIDVDSGREGTCWPKQWLATDAPTCRLLTVKYKTNLSEWSGATLPLQEVSEVLLKKLLAAGVGERPVVFITHSLGGLVVKQMLMQAAKDKECSKFLKKTAGVVFYSCPHFGSKLADMPWRFGFVIRPSPSTSELRSGSARLDELNQFFRTLSKGGLQVLSFSETKVTPLVEGYGGWALRMEVVPIESAYPGFGKLVVLDGSDHVNSCKPLNKDDAAYTQTLEFLQEILRSLKGNNTSQ